MISDEIKNEVEGYNSTEWCQSLRGKSAVALCIIFVITFWYRSFLAILILPMIYFAKKGSRSAMIIAGVYAGVLTIVNVAVYIGNNYNEQGGFESSVTPILIYFGMYIYALNLLRKAYVIEKLRRAKYKKPKE